MSRTNFSTYIAIKNQLLQMFREKKFENNRLPSEAELAKTLDISLTTLRESLMILALEGYITKKHGAGNYVHPSTLDFENRIFFNECLTMSGYTAQLRLIDQQIVPASAEVAEQLQISEEAPVLRIEKLHYADNKPAILSIMSIPCSMFIDSTVTRIDETDFLYLHDMMWKHCRSSLAHSLNSYVPLALPAEAADLLELPAGTPIIANAQVFYDTFDKPVIHSFSYFNPKYHTVRNLQNWALEQPL